MSFSMKTCAAAGILTVSVVALSFAQRAPDRGSPLFERDRFDKGSPYERTFSTGTGTIMGTVVKIDGKPQSDMLVEVRDFITGRIIASVYTDVAGAFTVNQVQYGTYEVVISRGAVRKSERIEMRDSLSVLTVRLSTSAPNAPSTQNGFVSVSQLRVPEHAHDAYLKAQQALIKHRPEQVSKYLQKALDIYPSYAPALTMRGIMSMDKHEFQTAVEDFDKAIHADSSYAGAYAAMAMVLNQLHKFDDALRAAERASSLAPNLWQAHVEMASSYIGKGDYRRALQQLTQVQQQLPQQYPPLHLLRASALLGLNKYQDAAAELKSFVKAAPNDPRALEVQGVLRKISAFLTSEPQ